MAAIIGAAEAEGKDSLSCRRFSCDRTAAAGPGPAAGGRARIATASLALPLRHSSLSLSPVERGGGHVQGRPTLDLEHLPDDRDLVVRIFELHLFRKLTC